MDLLAVKGAPTRASCPSASKLSLAEVNERIARLKLALGE
jgi:hypothetical protein